MRRLLERRTPLAELEPGSKTGPRLSLARQILIGLFGGIAVGLFVGEPAGALAPIGNAFIALLQMTVLPFIMIALMVNVGGLSRETAGFMATRAVLVMLGLWAIGLVLVALLSLALPVWETASFFSTSLTESPEAVDYIDLYIPSNPFRALSQSLIPAVVVFSIAVGAALIGLRNNERLLEPLQVMIDALGRVNGYVVRLSPIGVFAMTAAAAGTITLAEIERLQGYIIGFLLATLILTFWILPGLVSALTPVPYRSVLRVSQEALVTALATDNVFIVLPQLIDNAKTLLKENGVDGEAAERSVDVAMPIAFTFPNLGKLMALLFIPFAAWYVGDPVGAGEVPAMLVTGLLTLFGKTTIAIPFLLDMIRLPADLFQLFLIAGIPVARFGSLLAAMNLLAFSILTACATEGALKIQPRRMLIFALVTTGLVGASVVGTRQYLSFAMRDAYDRDQVVAAMQLMQNSEPSVVLEQAGPNPVPLAPDQSRLDRILRRGVLRVGFVGESLPFTYFNRAGDLVGFDAELAHVLARDLGVSLEFVPSGYATMAEQLESDHFDILMSGLPGSVSIYQEMLLATPHLELTPALLVPDHRRAEFATHELLLAASDVRIGVNRNDPYIIQRLREFLPDATIVEVESVRAFLEGTTEPVDGLAISAEAGSAWSLLYPSFGVVFSLTDVVGWPAAYPLASDDPAFATFFDQWIELKRSDGTIQRAYDYWILGRNAVEREPRWSIMRDVLHWAR